jgi:hypothetical protein
MLVVFDEEFNRGARGIVLKGFLAGMEMAAIKATCRMSGSRSLLFLYEGPVTCEHGCKQVYATSIKKILISRNLYNPQVA